MALPTCGVLNPTKTFAKAGDRRWAFIANEDAATPGTGTLTLIQGGRDLDSYGVEIVETQVLFCKKADGEMYGVDLDRAGRPCRCNCKGFAFKKTCKHFDAATALIAEGVLNTGTPTPKLHASADLQSGF